MIHTRAQFWRKALILEAGRLGVLIGFWFLVIDIRATTRDDARFPNGRFNLTLGNLKVTE